MTVTKSSPGETTGESLGRAALRLSAEGRAQAATARGSGAWVLGNSTPGEGAALGSVEGGKGRLPSPQTQPHPFPSANPRPKRAQVSQLREGHGHSSEEPYDRRAGGKPSPGSADPRRDVGPGSTARPVLGQQLGYPPVRGAEKGPIDPYRESIVYNL